MIMQDLLPDIINSFSGLWKTKQRGESIEIITPYATNSNSFISIFLTFRNNEFIISDGGWLSSGVYNTPTELEENCFSKIFYHNVKSFNIKETSSPDNIIYYYNKTRNIIDLPLKILELSTFLQIVISASYVEFENKQEAEIRRRFVSKANNYFKANLVESNLKINTKLEKNNDFLRFNIIYNKGATEISLINYITGSTYNNFSNSIFKANTLFEMTKNTDMNNYIVNKISLIDNEAPGFVPAKIDGFLRHLENNAESQNINWSDKERILELLK